MRSRGPHLALGLPQAAENFARFPSFLPASRRMNLFCRFPYNLRVASASHRLRRSISRVGTQWVGGLQDTP